MSSSVAKPLATLTLLVVMAEHELDLDDRVTAVWPEYGAAGKETTTLRHLLRHAAGLYCFPPEAAALVPDDTAALVDLMAAAAPLHEPGAAFGEHAATYGHLLGEVVRRVTGESLESRWPRIARDAGWDLHPRVEEADEHRVATVVPVADDWPSRYADDPRWAPALVRPGSRHWSTRRCSTRVDGAPRRSRRSTCTPPPAGWLSSTTTCSARTVGSRDCSGLTCSRSSSLRSRWADP
jgi:CubicO group peptidase (beta-lactamase class C family)